MGKNTRRLAVFVTCVGWYKSHIDVPVDMSLDEACAYANQVNKTDEGLPIESEIEWVEDYDEITPEDVKFADEE